jgi:putative protein-disulfide isomerase
MSKLPEEFCDPQTQTCLIANSGISPETTLAQIHIPAPSPEEKKTEIIYVGDPMCSWCWGMSPSIIKLRDYFAPQGIGFRLVTGGLRPGGGDRWDESRKDRLRQTWQIVAEKSGQQFGYKILDLEHFDYDTEPACRAVVAARSFAEFREMEFFEEIQRKFYVESHDPKDVEFYHSICDQFDINFTDFQIRFENDEVKEETFCEFDLNRKWGVQAFPAVLVSKEDKIRYVTQGFSTYEKMENKVRELIK